MTARNWILAAAGVAMLAGCADYPYYGDNTYYDSYGYRSYPYSYYSYGPGYYVAPPSVSFGLAYSDGYYRRRWHG